MTRDKRQAPAAVLASISLELQPGAAQLLHGGSARRSLLALSWSLGPRPVSWVGLHPEETKGSLPPHSKAMV